MENNLPNEENNLPNEGNDLLNIMNIKNINVSIGEEKQNKNKKKKQSQKEQLYYFGSKKAQKFFITIPQIINLPEKTDVVVSNAFRNIVRNNLVNVKRIIVPNGVREIQNDAFNGLVIQETIIIPDSVQIIGNNAFRLGTKAFVTCSTGSKAYDYCKQQNLRNSVDIKKPNNQPAGIKKPNNQSVSIKKRKVKLFNVLLTVLIIFSILYIFSFILN